MCMGTTVLWVSYITWSATYSVRLAISLYHNILPSHLEHVLSITFIAISPRQNCLFEAAPVNIVSNSWYYKYKYLWNGFIQMSCTLFGIYKRHSMHWGLMTQVFASEGVSSTTISAVQQLVRANDKNTEISALPSHRKGNPSTTGARYALAIWRALSCDDISMTNVGY